MILPLNQVEMFEPIARKMNVSKVARSERGFLTAYKKAKSYNDLPEEWKRKREAFIARHLVQYNKRPTLRRALALIMWAHYPFD